jgi:hypothetical protein
LVFIPKQIATQLVLAVALETSMVSNNALCIFSQFQLHHYRVHNVLTYNFIYSLISILIIYRSL